MAPVSMNEKIVREILDRAAAAQTPEERSWVTLESWLDSLTPELNRAVWAMAIPHWFNEKILGAVCPELRDRDRELYEELQELPFVEVFEERGHNLHEVARKQLLERLWQENCEEYLTLSARSAEYFGRSKEPAEQIEGYYHRVVADPDSVANMLDRFLNTLNDTFRFGELDSLVRVLSEQVESDRISMKVKAIVWFWKGKILQRLDRNEEALENYQVALNFYRKIQDRLGETQTLGEIKKNTIKRFSHHFDQQSTLKKTIISLFNFWKKRFFKQRQTSLSNSNRTVLILEPILTPSFLLDLNVEGVIVEPYLEFTEGFFTVGGTGKVEIDFLWDGSVYQGEVAIFSLEGMDELLESEDFIREAARRAASNSQLGYTVTCNRTKTLTMRTGDCFGIMLTPNSTVDVILKNPKEISHQPLLSLKTDNPNDDFNFGQIVDLTGEGDTFMIEDLRPNHELEGDFIFKVRGAIGKAPTIDELAKL